MSGLRRRLDKLAARHTEQLDEKPEEAMEGGFENFWEMQLEWTALHLIRRLEPDFTLDEADAFWTLDGRFAVSQHRMDLRGLMGPRTQEIQERLSSERWERFLEAGVEAAELLERLLELAGDEAVPEDYREPGHQWHDLGEVNDRLGNHELGSIFEDAEEREATRRMTWTLIHNPHAREMLSELTRRRDAFEGHRA